MKQYPTIAISCDEWDAIKSLADELYRALVGVMDIENARIGTGAFRPNNIAKARIEAANLAIIRYHKGKEFNREQEPQ